MGTLKGTAVTIATRSNSRRAGSGATALPVVAGSPQGPALPPYHLEVHVEEVITSCRGIQATFDPEELKPRYVARQQSRIGGRKPEDPVVLAKGTLGDPGVNWPLDALGHRAEVPDEVFVLAPGRGQAHVPRIAGSKKGRRSTTGTRMVRSTSLMLLRPRFPRPRRLEEGRHVQCRALESNQDLYLNEGNALPVELAGPRPLMWWPSIRCLGRHLDHTLRRKVAERRRNAPQPSRAASCIAST